MEDDLITTKEVGDYRIKVYYCRDSECPITMQSRLPAITPKIVYDTLG